MTLNKPIKSIVEESIKRVCKHTIQLHFNSVFYSDIHANIPWSANEGIRHEIYNSIYLPVLKISKEELGFSILNKLSQEMNDEM